MTEQGMSLGEKETASASSKLSIIVVVSQLVGSLTVKFSLLMNTWFILRYLFALMDLAWEARTIQCPGPGLMPFVILIS